MGICDLLYLTVLNVRVVKVFFFGGVSGSGGEVQIFAPESIKGQYQLLRERTEYPEGFLRNLLLNENHELPNRNLHISGLLTDEKVDIEGQADIEASKEEI